MVENEDQNASLVLGNLRISKKNISNAMSSQTDSHPYHYTTNHIPRIIYNRLGHATNNLYNHAQATDYSHDTPNQPLGPKRRQLRVYSCRFLTANSRSRPRFGSTVALEMCCAKERTTTKL